MSNCSQTFAPYIQWVQNNVQTTIMIGMGVVMLLMFVWIAKRGVR